MTGRTLSADDHAEIQQLYARYAMAVDLGDGDARAATFVPEGVFLSRLSDTPDDVETMRRRTNELGNRGTRHLQYNLVVTPTDEGAHGLVCLLYLQAGGEAAPIAATMGLYEDRLVRTPQGWRFKSRQVWGDHNPASPYRATAIL